MRLVWNRTPLQRIDDTTKRSDCGKVSVLTCMPSSRSAHVFRAQPGEGKRLPTRGAAELLPPPIRPPVLSRFTRLVADGGECKCGLTCPF